MDQSTDTEVVNADTYLPSVNGINKAAALLIPFTLGRYVSALTTSVSVL